MELLNVGYHCHSPITEDFHWTNTITLDKARLPDSSWIVISLRRRCRERKQKWGFFHTNHPQSVRVCAQSSSTWMLSTGSTQGFLQSSLLFSSYTHDCIPSHPTSTVIKFAHDTTLVGLITGGDKSGCRDKMQWLAKWFGRNNLSVTQYQENQGRGQGLQEEQGLTFLGWSTLQRWLRRPSSKSSSWEYLEETILKKTAGQSQNKIGNSRNKRK